ncbi:MAG: hypothetical protein NTU89_01735 [Candidatus Dependentiae bacterium]|nr:hypothetical protein [Candidatus Dependentiae bacterium]
MKNSKKLLLLSVLGLLACAPKVSADTETDRIINETVSASINNIKGIDNAALKKALSEIKSQLTAIIAASPNAAEYKELQTALGKLNPEALFASLACIQTILSKIPSESKDLILTKVPPAFHKLVSPKK